MQEARSGAVDRLSTGASTGSHICLQNLFFLPTCVFELFGIYLCSLIPSLIVYACFMGEHMHVLLLAYIACYIFALSHAISGEFIIVWGSFYGLVYGGASLILHPVLILPKGGERVLNFIKGEKRI